MKKINLKLKNNKEKKLIGNKIRCFIDFIILACCFVIVFNMNLNTQVIDDVEKSTMTYIFHDYLGNTYILNEETHGTSVSLEFLLDKDVPESVKNDVENVTGTASLGDVNIHQEISSDSENSGYEDVKDNQITIEEIGDELGIDLGSGDLVIDFDNLKDDDKSDPDSYYTVNEDSDGNIMIITKNGEDNYEYNMDENDESDSVYSVAKIFTFVVDGYVQPILISRDQLPFNNKTIAYIDNNGNVGSLYEKPGVTIIDDYADCMTPRGYKIVHGDSVLAYHQKDNAPDICDIERRFCWKGKLSGTYTQQGCSVNTNYTYAQWGESEISVKDEDVKPDTVQNLDGSVKVNDDEIGSSFVFDRPSKTSTPGYYESDNIKVDEEVNQTTRPHWDCTAPWGEKVGHGQLVQAFKHANGFSDAPCQAQIRICTNGDLVGSYTEPNCKTRDTSFIDWINGSPTWATYSREKLEWIKKLVRAEQSYDRDFDRRTNSDELDRILTILDA